MIAMNGLFLLLLPLIVYGTRLRFGQLLGKQGLSKVTTTSDSLMGILRERPIWLDDYGAPPDLNPPLEGWQSCIRLSLDHKTMTINTNGAAHMLVVRGEMVYEHDGSAESSVQVAEGDFIIIVISNPLVPRDDLGKLCHRAHFMGRLYEFELGPEYFYDRMAIRIERERESERVSVDSEPKENTGSDDLKLEERKRLSKESPEELFKGSPEEWFKESSEESPKESSEESPKESSEESSEGLFEKSRTRSFTRPLTQSSSMYTLYVPCAPCVQSLSIDLPTSRLQKQTSAHTKTCERTSRRHSPRSRNAALSDPKSFQTTLSDPKQLQIAPPGSGSPLSINLSESDNISGSKASQNGPVVSLDDLAVQKKRSSSDQKRTKFKDQRSRSFLSLDTSRLTRRSSNKEKKHNVSAEEEISSPKAKERKTLPFERMKRSRSKSPQPVESKDPDSPKQTDK